jgi:hypothetical protein
MASTCGHFETSSCLGSAKCETISEPFCVPCVRAWSKLHGWGALPLPNESQVSGFTPPEGGVCLHCDCVPNAGGPDMSMHSLNTTTVFLNANPATGAGFAAARQHAFGLPSRRVSQGMPRGSRRGPDQRWAYAQPDWQQSPQIGSPRNLTGGLSPVLWARLVLCGSFAS